MDPYLIFIHIVFCQFHLCHVSCCLFDGIMSCLYIISSMLAIIMWYLNIMLCLWCQLISFYHCHVFFYLAFAISICCVCYLTIFAVFIFAVPSFVQSLLYLSSWVSPVIFIFSPYHILLVFVVSCSLFQICYVFFSFVFFHKVLN